MDQSLTQRVHSTCALNVCMQMGARAVRLQCTSWTSMTAKSTHTHYEMDCGCKHVHEATTVAALRMEKDNIFNRQTFAIKIVQIIKYKKSCRFKKGLLICGTKPRKGCSQCQVLPLILRITSPLTYGLPGTSHEGSSTSPIKRPLLIYFLVLL